MLFFMRVSIPCVFWFHAFFCSVHVWNLLQISNTHYLVADLCSIGEKTTYRCVWNLCVFEICGGFQKHRSCQILATPAFLKSMSVWNLYMFEIHACLKSVRVWNPCAFEIRERLKSVRVWNPCVFEIRVCLKSVHVWNLCVFEIHRGFQKMQESPNYYGQ